MMEKMIALQQKRRSKKGGFTLVELIVVLVILAILAALLIPALTGYIDKAKQKRIVAETRQCVMAAQTLYDEAYGKNSSADEAYGKNSSATEENVKTDELKKLAEVKGDISGLAIDGTSHKVSALTYTSGSDKCVYDGSTYEVNPKSGK